MANTTTVSLKLGAAIIEKIDQLVEEGHFRSRANYCEFKVQEGIKNDETAGFFESSTRSSEVENEQV